MDTLFFVLMFAVLVLLTLLIIKIFRPELFSSLKKKEIINEYVDVETTAGTPTLEIDGKNYIINCMLSNTEVDSNGKVHEKIRFFLYDGYQNFEYDAYADLLQPLDIKSVIAGRKDNHFTLIKDIPKEKYLNQIDMLKGMIVQKDNEIHELRTKALSKALETSQQLGDIAKELKPTTVISDGKKEQNQGGMFDG